MATVRYSEQPRDTRRVQCRWREIISRRTRTTSPHVPVFVFSFDLYGDETLADVARSAENAKPEKLAEINRISTQRESRNRYLSGHLVHTVSLRKQSRVPRAFPSCSLSLSHSIAGTRFHESSTQRKKIDSLLGSLYLHARPAPKSADERATAVRRWRGERKKKTELIITLNDKQSIYARVRPPFFCVAASVTVSRALRFCECLPKHNPREGGFSIASPGQQSGERGALGREIN